MYNYEIGDKVKVKIGNLFKSKVMLGEIVNNIKDVSDDPFGFVETNVTEVKLEDDTIVEINNLESFSKYKIIGVA